MVYVLQLDFSNRELKGDASSSPALALYTKPEYEYLT